MKWLTIESAPRDGTHILVWDSATEQVYLVTFQHVEFVETIEEYWAPSGITHWMPLPERPA